MKLISKTEFKARTLAVLRAIEKSGQAIIITDRGKPTLEIRKIRKKSTSPLALLRGSVIQYEAVTDSVADNDWENA